MDFMNLNQAAHGDREAGFIHTRLRLGRKVVVGHWQDPEVQDRARRLDARRRAPGTTGRAPGSARFGDNMRQVAVTEGDKVAAQMQFGFAVERLRRRRPGREGRCGHESRASTPSCAEYESHYHVAADLKKGAARHDELARRRPPRAGPARVSGGRRLQGLHRPPSRTCTG